MRRSLIQNIALPIALLLLAYLGACLVGAVLTTAIKPLVGGFEERVAAQSPLAMGSLRNWFTWLVFSGFFGGVFSLITTRLIGLEWRLRALVSWAATVAASVMVAFAVYFSLPGPLTPDIIMMTSRFGLSGGLAGVIQWLYLRWVKARAPGWLLATIVCWLLFGLCLFWLAPDD